MTFEQDIARSIQSIPRVQSFTGVFFEMAGDLALVNLNGTQIAVKCDGWAPPVQGMNVRLQVTDGVPRLVGPAQPLPTDGVIKFITGPVATVDVDGTDYQMRFLGTAPTSGDTVVIHWQSRTVLGKPGTYTPPPPPVEPPPIVPQPKPFANLLVQANGSGRYQTSWWGESPWASSNNDGIWTYGEAVRQALAGAWNIGAEIYLPLIQQLGNAAYALHPHGSIPSGAPTLLEVTGMPARSGWVALPAGWGEWLRDNTGGIGVTAPGGGFNKWRGRYGPERDDLSGALRFSGTR